MQNVSSKVSGFRTFLSKLIIPSISFTITVAFLAICVKYPQAVFASVRFVLDHPSVMFILIAVSIFWLCAGILWRILKTRSWVAKYPGWVAFGTVFVVFAVLSGGGLVHLIESSYYQNSIAFRVFRITPEQIKPRMVIVADACMPVAFGLFPSKVENSSVCQTALADGRRGSIFIDPAMLDAKRFNTIQGATILHALRSDFNVGVKIYNAKMAGKAKITPSTLNVSNNIEGNLAQVPKS